MRGLVGTLVVAAVVLAGCSSGGDGTKTAEPASTSTTVAPGCPPLATTAGPTDATTAAGDFDGDGRADRLVTYRVAAGGAWRVRTELAAGGGAEAELPAAADGVKAVGGARLDVGPAEAAFAVVSRSATGTNLGLYVLRGCRLERVALAGRPAELPVANGAAARSGLACQVPGLVAYQATSSDGRFFQASSIGYLLVGAILDEAHRSTSTLGADDATLAAYGAFSCGPLRL